ncbi:MAG: hypothetical protein WDO18_10875 [Acidobacteriota bacterium]
MRRPPITTALDLSPSLSPTANKPARRRPRPKSAPPPAYGAPPSFTSEGKQLLGALTLDGVYYIGSMAGLTSRPAKPGETIVTYGVGFGLTDPAVPAGTITGALNKLADPFVMTIGGVQVPAAGVIYAGLAPDFVGLYQFNIVVPSNLPDGDLPVTVKVGNATVPQTLFLSVKH